MSESPGLFPWQRIWSAVSINRLRQMGMIIDLEHNGQAYVACAICLNRGYILDHNDSTRICMCYHTASHSS